MKNKLNRFFLKLFNSFLWGSSLFFLMGGIQWGGKIHGAYAGDITRIIAITYIVFRILFQVRFSETRFYQTLPDSLLKISFSEFKKRPLSHQFFFLSALYLILVFTINPLIQYFRLGNLAFDLGIFINTLYNAATTGKFATGFLLKEKDLVNYLPDNHLDLGLIFFVPLFKIFPHAGWLLISQSLALIAGGVFFAKLAIHFFKDKIYAIGALILYASLEPIHRMNMWDWHETSMMIPCFLVAVYFLEKKKMKACILSIFLFSIWRADAWLTTAVFGLYLVIRTRQVRYSALTLIGLGIFLLYHKMNHSVVPFHLRYNYLPKELHDWPSFFLNNPFVFLKQVFVNREFFIRTTLMVGGPFFLLSGPFLAVIAAPLGIVGLSTWDAMLNYTAHYPGMFIGPLLYGSLLGFKFLHDRNKLRFFWGFSIVIALSQLQTSAPGQFRKMVNDLHTADCLKNLVKIIPADAKLLVVDPLAAYLSYRPWIAFPDVPGHYIPNPADHEKVVLNQFEYLVSNNSEHLNAGVTRNLSPVIPIAEWKVIKEDCGFYIAKNQSLIEIGTRNTNTD